MEGPGHFEAQADMAGRRADVAALARPEAWQPLVGPAAPPPPAVPPSPLWARAMQATLNGHLVPFWGRIGARRRIAITDRAPIWPLWGAAEAEFVDAGGGRHYRVVHDKRLALALALRALRLAWRWTRAYPALVAAHRAAYGPMTAPEAWAARFAVGAADPESGLPLSGRSAYHRDRG
jgi:hypothetical protein